MRIITSAIALFVLAGCSTGKYYNYPPGGTDLQFQKDSYECLQASQQSASNAYIGPYGGAANSGTTTNAALAHACMRARGYQETSRPKK